MKWREIYAMKIFNDRNEISAGGMVAARAASALAAAKAENRTTSRHRRGAAEEIEGILAAGVALR